MLNRPFAHRLLKTQFRFRPIKWSQLFSILLTCVGGGMAVWFFVKERGELSDLRHHLGMASPAWVLAGMVFTGLYILLQGLMYQHTLRAAGARALLSDTTLLYLKRNFVSPFLPAGGMVSLGMFGERLQKRGVAPTAMHFASSLYALVGLASLGAISVPVLFYLLWQKNLSGGETLGFLWVLIMLVMVGTLVRSLKNGGKAALFLLKKAPGLRATLTELRSHPFVAREVLKSLAASFGIEAVGMLHLWMAMQALGLNTDWKAAAVSYVVSILVMTVSPFLRGLGAVELAMAFVLAQFGMAPIEAMATTLLFRFFEFWLVLLAGVGAFLQSAEGLALRVLPPAFLFALGLVNVVSSVTPAHPDRVRLLRDFLPLDWMHSSNFLVLTAGLVLLLTSVYLVRGLRLAWWVATLLTVFSIVGHVVKGFDYEEATLGLVTLIALLRTKGQFFIKMDRRKGAFGAMVFAATLGIAVLYGSLGFYFLDKNMFGFDFTWGQSVGNTLRLFFLLDADYLHPLTPFARHFMVSLAFAGMLSILLGLYYLLLPHIAQFGTSKEELEEARHLVKKYGQSSLDYFKTYFDKQIFFTADRSAFVAYKIAKNYAVVLEKPVAPDDKSLRFALRQFEQFCKESGLQPIYYRVLADDLALFRGKKRKALRIGQEAVADVQAFSLDGKSVKPLRNAVNRAEKEGVKFQVYEAPVRMGVLQKCKAVSDAWLAEGRREIAFSSGIFSFGELRQQTILTVEDAEERVVAFVNLIPDYAYGEATYDLLRRLPDAPGWSVDFLMVNLMLYLQNKGYQRLNLGLTPMAGLEGGNFPERTLQFVYRNTKSFAHYQGLRAFKEKFAKRWNDQYLVYTSDADLLAMPRVMLAVEKM